MRRVMVIAGLLGVLAAEPALAQSAIEGRVGRLESEMRAVQRKVFPGGAGSAMLQPDIAAPEARPDDIGTPATAPIADLTSRVASLEQQIATLTGQVEQDGYKTRQLQDAFDAYKRQTDARLKAVEEGAAVSANTGAGGPTMVDEAADDAAARPARGPAARLAADESTRDAPVAAVERPSSGDAAEDEYLYGYRLWQAKQYPQAEAQLKKFVADHPKHRRASYAQNLLGRAYLDEGKPSLASIAFYDNYKKMPDGERAPDSLQYLAQALIRLNKPADACKVYGELTDVYGAKMSAAMRTDVARGRVQAKCK